MMASPEGFADQASTRSLPIHEQCFWHGLVGRLCLSKDGLPSLQDHPFNLKMTIAILADSSQFVERLPQFLSSYFKGWNTGSGFLKGIKCNMEAKN